MCFRRSTNQLATPPPPADSADSSQSIKTGGGPVKLPRPEFNRSDGAIWISYIDGLGPDYGILADQEVRFVFKLENNTSNGMMGMTNGFVITTPDGAEWTTVSADTLGTVNWASSFDLIHMIDYRSITGSDADTVAFAFSVMQNGGLPAYFDDTAWSITIGPIDPIYVGREVCIDSCYYPPSGLWKWAYNTTTVIPEWGGPYCLTVEEATIEYSGTVYYENPVPGASSPAVLSGVPVQLWDYDSATSSSELLGQECSLPTGDYSIECTNVESDGSVGQDVYFVIPSQLLHARVRTDLQSSLYQWSSDTSFNVSSGSHYKDLTIPADSAGPYFLLDKVIKSFDGWNAIAGDNAIYDLVEVVLSTTCTTGYRYSQDVIYVNDSTNSQLNMWSLEFSEWALYHEYGHRISHKAEFLDESPGGTHWLGGTYSDSLAASEGWSHFWAGYVQDSSMLVNYWNSFNNHDWLDLENGVFSDSGVLFGSANAMGLGNEGAVAGILWDIYDDHDDDYSSLANYGSLSLPHWSDGVWDSLSSGINTIVDVVANRFLYYNTANARHPDDMNEFWTLWFDPYDKSLHHQAMIDIYYEHGDSTRGSGCCYGITGNINGDSEESIDVSDIVMLVAYMFNQGPAPVCMDETDFNGSGYGPDISDLVYLVTYMYSGGPAPVPCQ